MTGLEHMAGAVECGEARFAFAVSRFLLRANERCKTLPHDCGEYRELRSKIDALTELSDSVHGRVQASGTSHKQITSGGTEYRSYGPGASPATPLSSRSVGDGSDASIVGYASVFYDGTPATTFEPWEDVSERVMPGTFDRALAERDDVRGLLNHDPGHVLGRTRSGTMSLSIDSRGLKYSISLDGDSSVADVARRSISRGDVSGSSFAFRVTDEDFRKEDDIWIREIRGVRLFDVGPVTFPAYEATSVQLAAAGAFAAPGNDRWRTVSETSYGGDPESQRLARWVASLR